MFKLRYNLLNQRFLDAQITERNNFNDTMYLPLQQTIFIHFSKFTNTNDLERAKYPFQASLLLEKRKERKKSSASKCTTVPQCR